MAAEARAIVAEWRMEADREGAASQVKAMLWRLRTLLSEQGGTELDAAIDVLSREARKL